jgi:epoxide hydrolase-like predicted phosphatase
MSSSGRLRYEVVLFDFGGVYIDSPFLRLEAHSEILGVDANDLIELTLGPLDRDTDHPWHQLERGELSMLDARVQIIDMYKESGIDADPFALLAQTIGPKVQARESVVECTRAVRASGLKTGLITNNAREIRDRWRALIPADDLFDDVVDSSEVGVRKPDPTIYEIALKRLGGIDAAAAIFLDDLEQNVAVAESLGMQGIVVEEDPEPALARLRSLVADD